MAVLVDGRMGLVADIVSRNRAIVSPRRRNTYRNICSEDDPPRSVAICPQRACVAFGCQGGIELHWIDALTGQDLSRWFPLSAASDCLYFLPPRRGVDSSKKLRLISSAVHPEEATPLGRRFGLKAGALLYWKTWEPGLFGSGQNDHYMAVPIDGVNVLFTDPDDGSVYLGGDAPVSVYLFLLGVRADNSPLRQLGGPTKLIRRIKLIPPPHAPPPTTPQIPATDPDTPSLHATQSVILGFNRSSPDSSWTTIEGELQEQASLNVLNGHSKISARLVYPPRPRVYAASRDVRYGVRIAVGYQDWLVFYTVPTELYDHGTSGSKLKYTSNLLGCLPPEEPLEIIGCHVGYVPGLVDVAVNGGPDMTVWAFSREGEAKVFKLEGTFHHRKDSQERVVMERGNFVNVDGPPGEVYSQKFDSVMQSTPLVGVMGNDMDIVDAQELPGNGLESPSVNLSSPAESAIKYPDEASVTGSETHWEEEEEEA